MSKTRSLLSFFNKRFSKTEKYTQPTPKNLETNPLKQTVLKDISTKFSFDCWKLSSPEYETRHQEVLDSLPTNPSLVYRGTVGNKEVLDALNTGYLGKAPQKSTKAPSHDIIDFVVKNESSLFYSTTPCPHTVMMYTEGLSLLPTVGNILVLNLPKVYVKPQSMLALCPEAFYEYDERNFPSISNDDIPQRFISIADRTRGNNEVTAVLGQSLEDNWRLETKKDLAKVVQVYSPGKVIKPFISAKKPIHVQQWDNPCFMIRPWSIEIILPDFDPVRMAMINQRALEFGMITKGERLLTIKDATVLLDSPELKRYENEFIADETIVFSSVPAMIKEGDVKELLDYVTPILEANTEKHHLCSLKF